MAITFNYKKGTDLPVWQSMRPFLAGVSYHGAGNAYDGTRYIYWCLQYGSASTGASATALYRFDTWTNAWQLLAIPLSGNRGMDVEFDPVRNVVYLCQGAALTSWQVFNLNSTPVTIANQSCPAWTLTTITIILPLAADYGASLTMPTDTDVPGVIDIGVAGTCTTTSITDTSSIPGSFGPGMIGLHIQFTSGTLNGQSRCITAVPNPASMTTVAFSGIPAIGDTFNVVLPTGTATSGSATTLVLTNAGWTTNFYANSDVVILSGTGAGQRRRIASNTVDTLTLAGAVMGNARTGTFTTPPSTDSVFQIVPSSDFLYYQPGSTGQGLYRIDLVQTTGSAWSASLGTSPGSFNSGANTVFAKAYDPFSIIATRGNGSSSVYRFGIGPSTWTTLTNFWGSETLSTGGSMGMINGKRKMLIQKESSNRLYAQDMTTGILEPFATLPFGATGAYDGHRIRHVIDINGVNWMYVLRAGGQELLRVPIEWL